MNENQLLFWCVITSVIGISVLFFVPELPSTDTYGELVWVQENRALLVVETPLWITANTPIIFDIHQCVRVRGVHKDNQITNALLTSVPANESENC